jgi:hypothetical protein
MTYHQIFDEKNIKGTISGAETVYLFEVLKFILVFCVVFLACRHDVTEILLKVALNTTIPPFSFS